jgi:flagellar basal body P-ring formation protein FlgA
MRAPPLLALARFAFGFLIALGAPARGEETLAPSPKAIIYPGEIITEDMLTNAPLAAPAYSGPLAMSPGDIVGMAAARTLLPGQSIPMASVAPPRALRAGAPVKMIYVDGGLTITASGSALQDGAVGQLVKVRNDDSGVTVSGKLRGDGSVLVNGG